MELLNIAQLATFLAQLHSRDHLSRWLLHPLHRIDRSHINLVLVLEIAEVGPFTVTSTRCTSVERLGLVLLAVLFKLLALLSELPCLIFG